MCLFLFISLVWCYDFFIIQACKSSKRLFSVLSAAVWSGCRVCREVLGCGIAHLENYVSLELLNIQKHTVKNCNKKTNTMCRSTKISLYERLRSLRACLSNFKSYSYECHYSRRVAFQSVSIPRNTSEY